ncbi:MAG: hypothetical protein ACI4RN_01535 [Oscillospiraceae bacterium]
MKNEIELKRCPICGRLCRGASALSRKDNQTYICSDCGTRESLEDLGVSTDEQEKILECIHRNQN